MPGRTVRIGSEQVAVPPLSAPVGRDLLRSRYPGMNASADLAVVDRYLAAVAALEHTPSAVAEARSTTPQRVLAVAQAVRNWRVDRNGAIAGFQRTEEIGGQEAAERVMLPGGATWETLVTYGELALRLEGVRDRPRDPRDYIHTGGFRERELVADVLRRFRADPLVATRMSAASVPDMLYLLGRLSADGRFIDVRWIAYVLATAFWEGAELVSAPRSAVSTGRPPARPRRVWRAMTPAREAGRGSPNDYYLPVKVNRLPDGSAEVTEQDGDRSVVSPTGTIVSSTPRSDLGAPMAARPSPAYVNAKGVELAFYGRGYVQLTWWSNYASNGAAIGLGLELLFDPDKTLDPDVAYRIISDGMIEGKGFANKHMLRHYIAGGRTDYVGARAIVNVRDPIPSIVRAAQLFEAALMANKA